MADVTLVLKANNSDHIAKMRESQTATQKVYDTAEKGGKREKGILEEIDATIQKLEKTKRKAFSYEDIEKLNKKLIEAKMHLKEYEDAGIKANEKIIKSGNTISQSIKSWVVGFASVTAAVTLFKGVIESTDTLSDKFKATLKGWEEGFKSMARAVANKDFENFFENLKSAIKEGQRYAETQDKISDATRASRIRIAENETALLKLREAQRSGLKTETERIEAGKEAQRIIKENAEERLKIAKETYDNEIKNASFISQQNEATVKNFLLEEPMLLRQVEIGKKYNKLIEERNRLAQETAGGYLNPAENPEVKLINAKIEALGGEAVAYGKLATGLANITDAQKDRIVINQESIESSKQSAINLRISSLLDNMMADKLKDNNKTLEEIYLERRDLFFQYIGDIEEANKKLNESVWNLGVKDGKAQFEQIDKQAKDIWDYWNNFNEQLAESNQASKEATFASIADSTKALMLFANQNAQARLDEARTRREDIDAKVEDAQRELDAEIKNGGRKTEIKRQQLNTLKAQQKEALKNEEAASQKAKELSIAAMLVAKAVAVAQVVIQTQVANAKLKALFPVSLGQPFVSLNNAAMIKSIIAIGVASALETITTAKRKFAKGGWTGNGGGRDETGERVAGIVHEKEYVVRRGPAHKFRDVLEAINRDDKRMILNSFNKLSPELLGGTTVNNIVVDNKGSNNRLDQLISENRKMNNNLAKHEIVQSNGRTTIIKKGNRIRTIQG